MIYGIGLQGPLGSWKEVPGRTVLQDYDALVQAEVLKNAVVNVPEGATFAREVGARRRGVRIRGLGARSTRRRRSSARPAPPPARSLEEVGAYAAGEFQVVNVVYDTGGERFPKLFNDDSLDFLAFWHKPRYVVVEVAPLVPTCTEAGAGAGHQPRSTRRASRSTCTWSATSARADSRRSCIAIGVARSSS